MNQGRVILVPFLRFTSFLAGASCAVWAHLVLADPDRAPTWDSRWSALAWPFQALLGESMPHWVALALMSLAGGTFLMAVAIGLPPRGAIPADDGTIPHGSGRGRRTLWIMAATLLVAAGLLRLGWNGPYRGLAAWCATLLGGFLAARAADSRRGTALRSPFTAGEWLWVFSLTAAQLLWLARDLGDWRWSGIPDESRFFEVANVVAAGKSDLYILSESGVFGYHPVLGSYYQAAFLRLFGADAFGWRMSSAFAFAVSLPFVYLLGRELFGRRGGAVAAVLLAATPLAVAFGHLGYNNVHVLPVLSAGLALVAWSIRSRSVAASFLSGVVIGVGWFTYYPARIVGLLAVALARSLGAFRLRRNDRALTIALIAGLLLTALPLFVRPTDLFRHMLEQTSLAAPAGTTNEIGRAEIAKMAGNWLLSLFYGVWARETHLQSNPMLDPITATASITGFWLALAAFARRRRAGFLAFAYVLSAFLVGGFSQYDTPPITRLLFLTPISALLAAFAIEPLLVRLEPILGRRPVAALAAVALAVAVLLGAADIRYQTRVRSHGYGDGTTSELMRVVSTLPSETAVIYIQRADTFMIDVNLIANQYGWGDRLRYVHRFEHDAEAALAAAEPPVAVFIDLRDSRDKGLAEGLVTHRFPGAVWQDTDPGQRWNLRFAVAPRGHEQVAESPDLPAACR